MSFLSSLSNFTGNVGRGAEDLFTLGGTEGARKWGGQGAKKILNPMATGLGANFEAGAAGGSAILGGQAMGIGGGASAMTPYMPASTPAMGSAGSTLGGGIGSSMNLAPAYGSATGAGAGAAVPGAAAPSAVSQALNYMRMMPQGGGQAQAPASNQANMLAKLYQMFPGLKPGAQMGQNPNVGGM